MRKTNQTSQTLTPIGLVAETTALAALGGAAIITWPGSSLLLPLIWVVLLLVAWVYRGERLLEVERSLMFTRELLTNTQRRLEEIREAYRTSVDVSYETRRKLERAEGDLRLIAKVLDHGRHPIPAIRKILGEGPWKSSGRHLRVVVSEEETVAK